MNLKVIRNIPTHYSTIGTFSIDDEYFSRCLEPTDRGLTSEMTLAHTMAIKVPKQTCIADGTYKIVKYKSPKHGWVLALVDVLGFGYVEIHIGNYPHDTEACLLPGSGIATDMVTNSGKTVQALYAKVFPALDAGEEVTITYIREYSLPVQYNTAA